MQQLLKLTVLFALLSGCNTYKTKYPYSLDDFRPELRKHLEILLNENYNCDNNPAAITYLQDSTNEKELTKLLKSEHPTLRAYAFYNLINKKTFEGKNLLLENLDDTAKIWRCDHYGQYHEYLADYFIYISKGKTKLLKEKLTEEVIMKHSNLLYASRFAVENSPPKEKYYSIIKKMAFSSNENTWDDRIKWNYIYALSKYKKPDDIYYISNQLSYGWRSLGEDAFKIIVENPDSIFFKILEKYYSIISNPKTTKDLEYVLHNSSYKLKENYNSFLEALIGFKNKKSAAIVTNILNRNLYPLTQNSKEDFRFKIYELLVKNSCTEYDSIITKLKSEALAYKRQQNKYHFEPMDVYIDTTLNKHDYKYW